MKVSDKIEEFMRNEVERKAKTIDTIMELEAAPPRHRLAAALAKAQGAMSGAKKDTINPHLRNKYADLASVWEACREPLANNGLAIVQLPEVHDTSVTVTTMLMHESGETITNMLSLPIPDVRGKVGDDGQQRGPAINRMQVIGSVITYARRYSLMAVVGIAPEEDDGSVGVTQHPQEHPMVRTVRETFNPPPPKSMGDKLRETDDRMKGGK